MHPVQNESGAAKRRRPAEVRELLLVAAEHVVARRGMAANALEIAAEAGVHRSVLYRHYGTVEELVRCATLRPMREFLVKIQQMTDLSSATEPKPLWQLLIGFLTDLMAVLDEHRDFLVMAMSESSPLGDVEQAELRRELDRVLDDIVDLARLEGGSRGLDISAVAVNTRLSIAMVMGATAYGSWLLPTRIDGDQQRLVDDMANFILYGARHVSDGVKCADR